MHPWVAAGWATLRLSQRQLQHILYISSVLPFVTSEKPISQHLGSHPVTPHAGGNVASLDLPPTQGEASKLRCKAGLLGEKSGYGMRVLFRLSICSVNSAKEKRYLCFISLAAKQYLLLLSIWRNTLHRQNKCFFYPIIMNHPYWQAPKSRPKPRHLELCASLHSSSSLSQLLPGHHTWMHSYPALLHHWQ